MDTFGKKMDFLTKHWKPFTRRMPARFQLATMDLLKTKRHWIRYKFDSCNFSLILRGRGRYLRSGVWYPVVAPCVITQWPGEPLEYGPEAGEDWDEFYLIYPRELYADFQEGGFIQ